MKKLMSFVVACFILTGLSISAFAKSADEVEISPRYLGVQVDHSWTYKMGTPKEKTVGKWTHFYTGDPAQRDGEYDTASHSVSYGHTFSGSFAGGTKKGVEVELGISFSKSEEFSISKNSASLKKGEYIKAYWIKNYDSYKVTQTDNKHTYGFEQSYPGGPYNKVNRYETDTTYVTVDKAIQPKIRIEYWKDNNKVRGIDSEDILEYVEYYEFIDGEYQLTNTEMQ